MRAVQIERHGGPEVLHLRKIPDPAAGPGEILVRAEATSINPVDVKTRAGVDRPNPAIGFPMTLGWDLAGTVEAVGDGVTRFRPGDRVVAMSAQIATGLGTWADLVALPESLAAHAPETVPPVEAACLPLAGLTAVQALEPLRLKEGQRLLVIGAAGAVGGLAVQLAAASGVAVTGLVSRPGHVQAVLELGAEEATHEPERLPAGGFDAVLDTAGFAQPDAVADGGRYVSIVPGSLPGFDGRPVDARMNFVEQSGEQLGELARLVEAGDLRLRVAATLRIDQIRAAHELFERGGHLGKICLTF